MMFVRLERARYTDIRLKTRPEKDEKFEVVTQFGFHVNYAKDCGHAIAELEIELRAKEDPDRFSIFLKLQGFFVGEGIISDEIKKEAHIQAYMQLFPLVQKKIAELMADAGMPPLAIAMAKLESDKVGIGKKDAGAN